MKRFIVMLLAALMLLTLCACGTASPAPAETAAPAPADVAETAAPADAGMTPDYGPLAFEYQGQRFGILDEAEPLLAALGDAQDLFVAASCAYQGDDYIYYYDGIELTVNEIGGVLRVSGIAVVDDTLKTPQGVAIGMDVQAALEAMDMDYVESDGVYTFSHGSAKLLLQANGQGEIIAIRYLPA